MHLICIYPFSFLLLYVTVLYLNVPVQSKIKTVIKQKETPTEQHQVTKSLHPN